MTVLDRSRTCGSGKNEIYGLPCRVTVDGQDLLRTVIGWDDEGRWTRIRFAAPD
jgi:hypothetical protein